MRITTLSAWLVALVLAFAAAVLPSPSHADTVVPGKSVAAPVFRTVRLAPPTRTVETVRIVRHRDVKGTRLIVRFNNGSRWSFGACPSEDSERCYWNADTMGTHGGRSFVRMYHRSFFLN